jgi:hypothetical protein
MKLGVGGQLGIDAGPTKEIEGNEGLGEKAVPKMKGKIRVRGTEASNEVILEGAYGPFSGITAVQMGGCELKVDVLGGHEGLEGGRGFVVEALKLGMLRYSTPYGQEPGKQERALLQTTGDTPKRLRDCKTLLVGDAPLGLGSGYEDLCVN